LLCERFGPLSFAMALVWDGERLSLILRRWCFLGIPAPMWLCPKSVAYEHVESGRFAFHVEIGHPLAGLIVRYRGWLVPDRCGSDDDPPPGHRRREAPRRGQSPRSMTQTSSAAL
jgi:hypothetical protein